MKKFKKVFAVLLTLAMVLGMSMTSFAAQTTTVTVKNLKGNVTASYVKILQPKADGSGWEFATGIDESKVGMSLDAIVAATGNTAEAGTINASLSNLTLSSLTYGHEQAAEDNQVVFSGMEAGLYAIKAVDSENVYVYSNMVAYVGYTDGNLAPVEVTAKGASNQVEKIITDANDASVADGDEVEYTVKAVYPFFATNTTTNSFKISDKVTNGKIKAGTVVVPTGFTVNQYAGTDTLELTLTNYNATKAGSTITITYTVVADGVSASDPLTNAAKTEVSVDGNTSATQAIVVTPSVDASVVKTDESGEPITDARATFELYKVVTTGGVELSVYDESNDSAKVNAVKVGVATTDNDGIAKFEGLDAEETYYVKETQAPEGYALEPKAYPLTGATISEGVTGTPTVVDGVTTVTTTYTATGFTSLGFEANNLNFHDSGLSSLPSTGGIGTTIFTIGGCAIMIIAAALFFASRRKTAK